MKCVFCGGNLGATETQNHPNPDFAEFKTCLNCGHQWARGKWAWLKEKEENEPKQEYFCPKCKVFFWAMKSEAWRAATGTFMSHVCGEVACFTRAGDSYHQKYGEKA